jgi:sec-independent protein translocase protein TatA
MTLPLGFLDFLGPAEMLIVGIVAILLFGERLPDVARSWGKKLVEVKKSVQGIREEFEAATREVTSTVNQSVGLSTGRSHASHRVDDVEREEATAPKFEPPPSESAAETR